ncbi:hypothetical protein Lalb_Chr22g0356631 [Lupinus albus]|uniref:Uncharacterized protein n=1 Tax=Lupinus albus TaxID=3870 RepID=A0A6A4NGI7_LUPAL|nr:hypothetical protein Lalb_Chr22g0356631 [Lupinus albus]
MEITDEYVSMPVSPMANYFNSTVLNVFVLGVLESEIPIDDSKALPLLQHVFLPISTRFSSIMVKLTLNREVVLNFFMHAIVQ